MMTGRNRSILPNVALAVVFIAGCTGPAAPAPTAAPPTAEPAPTAAPRPTAAPVAVASPTTAAAALAGPIKRTVRGAYVYDFDEQGRPRPNGKLAPFTLNIQEGPRDQDFRLGFFETNVGQLGPTWRAASWMATAVGALETGKDVSTLRVSWETNGAVDGPSLGGIMTTAFVSALTGDEIKSDVAMTGTINPDGTIGPVGGIQYKIEAAAKEGVKTFLIPVGQRTENDPQSGQSIDLIRKGQLAGVTVQEVGTLAEAYEALTGKALPRVQAPSRAPELSSASYDRLRPKVLEWTADYQESMGRFKTVRQSIQDMYEDNVADAAAVQARSQKRLNEGAVSAAYWDIQDAAIQANEIALGARAYEFYDRGDFDGAANAVVQGAGVSRVNTLIERLKSQQPSSPEEMVLIIDAWTAALWTVALDQASDTKVTMAKNAKDRDESFSHLLDAAAFLSREKYMAKAADDSLSFNFGREKPSGQKIDPQALQAWATVFKRAAEANLTYFDALVLDQAAQELGIRTETLKDEFAAKNITYVGAVFGASPGVQEYLEKTIGKGPALAYAQLGFALASYVASSELVTKYYALAAELDDDGNITGFGRERALSSLLDAAGQQSRERIAAVDKAGMDSSFPVFVFQMAQAAREGTTLEKADALSQYWYASLYARLMATLVAKN
jgi:uncharacterized protein